MKNISLLGGTGSIGTQTLEIIKANNDLRLIAFSFNQNVERACQIIETFKPQMVASSIVKHCEYLSKKYPNLLITTNICDIVELDVDNLVIINAIVGSAGLLPTVTTIKAGHDLLLANKESLVMAGDLVMKLSIEHNAKILPIDSEHSAIMQCLKGCDSKEVKRLILTASGGPFRTKNIDELVNVTPDEAVNHPNWQMGEKISVDSATMMNKGFEIIEAHYLFDMPLSKIAVVIHPESIIHSMVEYVDGSIIAQMGPSDMRIPINLALNNFVHFANNISDNLDFNKLGKLSFTELDEKRFEAVALAKAALQKRSFYPTVLNASNEAAVKCFLRKEIAFNDIIEIVKKALINTEKWTKGLEYNIDNILIIDKLVKQTIEGGNL